MYSSETTSTTVPRATKLVYKSILSLYYTRDESTPRPVTPSCQAGNGIKLCYCVLLTVARGREHAVVVGRAGRGVGVAVVGGVLQLDGVEPGVHVGAARHDRGCMERINQKTTKGEREEYLTKNRPYMFKLQWKSHLCRISTAPW